MVLLVCLLSTLSLSHVAFAQASSRRRNPYLHQTCTTKNGLPVNSIQQILQTRDGYLWLGTLGGLVRFGGAQFKVFNSANAPGLGVDRTRVLYEDNERTLWIGSNENGGLTRYRDGVFRTFTMRDGLPDNTVISIAGDRQGGIWIGTMRGLTRYHAGKFTSHLTKPGMSKGQVRAIWQDNTGRLWLGTNGHRLISWHGKPKLPSNLEIHYAALSFRRPGHVTYRYKLAGTNPHWVIAGKRRTAYFPHLAPGKYNFAVIANNGDGVWNLTGASVEVVVALPFWRTRWFLFVVLIILTGINGSVLAFRFWIARLTAAHAVQEAFSRQLLASQEAERKRVAAALHDSLGQSLLIIKNRADMGLSSVEDREAATEQLNEISAAASQAADEVRKIAYRLRPYHLDRFGLTKTLHDICRQASHASEIRCLTEIENIDGLFTPEAETNIYRIVQEACNNIIRHSQATEAKLEIQSKEHTLQLRISDNGKGFVPTAQNMQDPQWPGGFGLVGMAERVRMLNGSYQIESSPGHGTTITILLPIPGGSNER